MRINNINWKKEPLVIATSHKKERIIAPLFAEKLGMSFSVCEDFNSDEFGTFSGEVERKLNAVDTAKAKCEHAIEISNCQIAISSEGSFGPHPFIGFVPVNEELVFFLDRKNGIEAHYREISLKTNYGFIETKSWDDLKAFAEKSLFPSHALIVSSSDLGDRFFVKGIQSWELLRTTFDDLNNHGSAVKIQTDMRAMFNPTRMQVIENATRGLLQQLCNLCESCGYPNFRVQEVKRGLPCGRCNFPTRSILSHVLKCDDCKVTKEVYYPNHKQSENPQYCDYCNP